MEQTRNVCTRIPTSLFRRLKTCLAFKDVSQQDYVAKLIEEAVTHWEQEQAAEAQRMGKYYLVPDGQSKS